MVHATQATGMDKMSNHASWRPIATLSFDAKLPVKVDREVRRELDGEAMYAFCASRVEVLSDGAPVTNRGLEYSNRDGKPKKPGKVVPMRRPVATAGNCGAPARRT